MKNVRKLALTALFALTAVAAQPADAFSSYLKTFGNTVYAAAATAFKSFSTSLQSFRAPTPKELLDAQTTVKLECGGIFHYDPEYEIQWITCEKPCKKCYETGLLREGKETLKGRDARIVTKYGPVDEPSKIDLTLLEKHRNYADIKKAFTEASVYPASKKLTYHYDPKHQWQWITEPDSRYLLRNGFNIMKERGALLSPALDGKRYAKVCSLLEEPETLAKLHDAAKTGDLKTIRDLIKNGVDLNAKNNNGDTAVHIAVIHNRPEVVRCLLNNGALVNVKNSDGLSPLALAKKITLVEYNQTIQPLEELEKLSPNVNQFTQKNKE